MKKKWILFGISFWLSISLWAQTQSPHISFNETIHDFGTIKEADGKVTHRFEFVNTGAKPLILSNVKAACGCTTPKWTNTPVKPGEKGFIDVTFNPRGYRSFTKSIRVSSNGEPPVVTLIIKGTVQPAQAKLSDKYRYDIAGLKLRNRHVAYGKILKGQKQTRSIEVFNSSAKPLALSFGRTPTHLTVVAQPAVLKPNQTGKIVITFDSSKKDDWDYVYDNIFLKINGKDVARNNLNVSAVIKEDFSKLTPAQLAKAPKVSITPESFNFGTIKQGEKVNYTFKLTNQGKTPLIIRKIRSSCGCTAVMPQEKIVKPGKSTELKVTFDSTHKKGAQNKSITVITNDPKNDRKVLWVRGNVEVDK